MIVLVLMFGLDSAVLVVLWIKLSRVRDDYRTSNDNDI